MGKTLRTFSLAVAGVCALATGLLFASCDNFGGDVASFDPALFFVAGGTQDAAGGTNVGQSGGQAVGAFVPQSLGSLSANVSIPNMPALADEPVSLSGSTRQSFDENIPASTATNASALDISNSALPDIADATGTGYKFTATLAQAGAGGATYTAEGTYAAGVCSFEFADARSAAAQNYTLTVSLYYSDALVASGEKAVTVAAGAADFTADVSLAPNTASGASNGTLALPIKFSDTSVTSVGVNLIDSGGTDVAATYVEGGSSVALTSGAGTIASVTGGLPPGTYTLLMTFVKGSAQVGARTETLNVYPTLATKVWWTNSSTGLVSELVITSYDQTEFWVRGTDGAFYSQAFASAWTAQDSNVGSFAAPLATIQEAVDRIKTIGNTTTQYTVYIDGKVTVPADADYSSISDDYKKSLAYIDSAQKIAITGWTGSGFDIIDCGKKCRAITAASGAEVAITKLAIKNGDAVNYGGALYVGGGDSTVVLGDGALVNGNHCETNGGAIYCNGNLYICGSAVVGDYSPSMTAALEGDCGNSCNGTGGGISCSGNLYLGYSGKNSSGGLIAKALTGGIYRNYAKTYGGGINSTGTVTMASGSVGFNAAANGGAIYVSGDSAALTIENSEIYGNTADSGSGGKGGGVYVTSGGTLYFKSGIIGSDDASKGNNAKACGGGVFVGASCKLYMSGSARIAGNSAKNTAGTEGYGGGAYVVSGGLLCMSGSAIVGQKKTGNAPAATAANGERSNYAPTKGGGVYIIQPDGLKLGYKDETTPDPTFDGGIYYNYANSGGGIYSSFDSAGGALEIERGSVCYNGAGGDGGGIHGYTATGTYDAVIKITGGEVSCNSAGSGGGISAKTVYVGGGKIAGNTASDYGGGVYAGRDFYLYGSGVIGDPNKAQIAQANDCSNKAKAGGGVYSHKVYIGYSDASTPAACTGGIYRNYATATSTSDDNCYGGGGICIKGTFADWLFKMKSGTVAYNAGDSSDGYGGGLYIYGGGAIDSSLEYPEAIGGSFVGNGAKRGGALCYYRGSFAVGDSVHMPSATGEKGDNDIYIDNDICCLHLASPFDAATPTPVLTATPSAYSPGKKIFDSSIGSECSKIGVASNDDSIPWAVGNDGKLVKDCAIVYVASTSATPNPGDDDFGDGSEQHPYATIRKAASMFSDKTAVPGGTEYNPLFKNKVYVLSDITFSAGAGATGDCNFEVVGCAGGVEGSPVTLTFNTDSGSGFYVAPGQKVKLTDINITQSSGENEYAALMAAVGGELFLEDCSITGMRAKKCSAIAAEGPVHLKNVSVKNNVAIAPSEGGYVWGPAVFSKQGQISLLGKVEITGNYMEIPDGGGAGGTVQKEQNVWVGDNKDGTAYYEPLYVAGVLTTGTKIGVTTYDISKTVFTENYKNAGNAASPDTYFTSDDGFTVGWNSASKEAQLKVPSSLYVRLGGSDIIGNGTAAKPFATIQKALDKINGLNNASVHYTIKVEGVLAAAQHALTDDTLKAASLKIMGDSAATSVVSGGLSESSEPILYLSEVTVPVTIENIGFTNGKLTAVSSGNGGAIFVENCVGAITITDCGFTSCQANGGNGGAIYLDGGSLSMSGVAFTSNKAKNGGAIYIKKGSLEMTDGVISLNTATTDSGGGISIASGGTFTMSGGKISGNSASLNGGGINSSGIVCIYGDAVIGDDGASGTATSETDSSNKAGFNGGGIFNSGKLALGYKTWTSSATAPSNPQTLDGGVYYNYAQVGGGIYNASISSSLYIASGNISKNMAASTGGNDGGGGIDSYGASSKLIMTGGTVSQNNSANFGGGVLVYSGVAELTGVTISGNTASSNGGGFACVGGTVTMNSGTIGGLGAGNIGAGGAGVYMKKDAAAGTPVFTMKGGEVSYNTVASGGSGGGFMNQYGTLNIQDTAEISNNDGGSSGGGILTFGTTNMTGGTISANTAHNGGGVFVFQNDFAMSDGTISGNTATVNPSAADPSETGHGGGVYVNNLADGATTYLGDFKLSGAAYIPLGTGNDVYLQNSITIEGDLTHAAPAATITPSVYSSGTIVLTEASAGLVADNYDKFDVTPNGTETWSIDENGYLSQSAAGAGSVTIYTPEGQFDLSVDKTEITTSTSATKVTVTARNSVGVDISNSAEFSGWTIACYYGTSITPVKTQSGRQFTFATNYPKGAYRLTVTVTFKGAEYSDSFVITKTVD